MKNVSYTDGVVILEHQGNLYKVKYESASIENKTVGLQPVRGGGLTCCTSGCRASTGCWAALGCPSRCCTQRRSSAYLYLSTPGGENNSN